MSRFEAQPGIVTNGLVLNLDAGDPDSYTRSQPPYVEVLVVAGGGGGGRPYGGGGGAGGLIYNSAYQLTNASPITVTVGAGGAGLAANLSVCVRGNSGNNSVFGNLTAIGGGGGGCWGVENTTGGDIPSQGKDGGSSGGGGSRNSSPTFLYTGQLPGNATTGQGFEGGIGKQYLNGGSGGGGGSSQIGGTSTTQYQAGGGGNGSTYAISGTSTTYGGGGGGGIGGGGGTYTPSTGGTGGGGVGGYSIGGAVAGNGGNGTANTGGGGGGAGGTGQGANADTAGTSGAGGSGIVIVRYPGLPAATGGTITYVNGFTTHKFTSSGTFTPYLWNDVSGNGNNGTLTNGPTFNSYQWGGTIYVDGTDDYVDVAGTYPTGTNARTVAGWFKSGRTTKSGNADHIVNYGTTTSGGAFGFMLYSSDNWYFYGHGGATDFATGVVADTNWHYHCITYDGSTVIYYLDGTNVASASRTLSTTSGNMTLGDRPDHASGNESQGNLGAVQVYSRALSVTEVGQNFNTQRSRFGVGWPSAEAILAAYPNAPSGYYDIQPLGATSPVSIYCDMETNGGGWMHVGTISDNNESSNNSTNHPWGAPLNPEQDSGLWEDNNTLNEDSPSFTADYKNKIWYSAPFTQILIKDQGDTKRNLLYTNSGQITSNNNSLAEWFGSLQWQTNGSETSTSAYSNSRVTGLSITNFGVADPVLDSGNKSILLFKFGERDGVQDANKDRSMIAWHRHNQADNVDAPAGIGNFTNRGGTIDYRDIVPYAQKADFPGSSITGTPYNYSIWVR